MKCLQLFLGLLIGAATLVSCSDEDLTPVFLDLQMESLTNRIDATNVEQLDGSNYDSKDLATIASSKFYDIECWLNGEYLGIFELPCKIPMLTRNHPSDELRIIPCIRLNGASNSVRTYSFLNYYIKTFSLNSGESLTYANSDSLIFTYIDPIQFPFIDNFENGTYFVNSEDSADHSLSIISGSNNIAHIALPSDGEFAIETNEFDVPGLGNEAVWEIEYACEADIRTAATVQLSDGTFTRVPLVTIRDSNGEWRKIHIDLSATVNTYAINNVSSITLNLEGSANYSLETTNFYLDNVKVICYK